MEKENMVYVESGKYKPSFLEKIINIENLMVCKYLVTQKQWKKVMRNSPSLFGGGDDLRPVENIFWIDALKFCNKMSLKYGLQPVYKINKNKLELIIYSNGEEIYPSVADFTKTNGFRLPTEVEWEWVARGGKIAQENKTFDYLYSGGDDFDEVGWNTNNSKYYGYENTEYAGIKTEPIGKKKPNQLGIYDMSGNVSEWCYDTELSEEVLSKIKIPVLSINGMVYVENRCRQYRGGAYCDGEEYTIYLRNSQGIDSLIDPVGLRICKTINSIPLEISKDKKEFKNIENKMRLKSNNFYQNKRMILVEGGNYENKIANIKLFNFFIGKFQITKEEWKEIMRSEPCYSNYFKEKKIPEYLKNKNLVLSQVFRHKFSNLC